jgi:hypothetical protein
MEDAYPSLNHFPLLEICISLVFCCPDSGTTSLRLRFIYVSGSVYLKILFFIISVYNAHLLFNFGFNSSFEGEFGPMKMIKDNARNAHSWIFSSRYEHGYQ